MHQPSVNRTEIDGLRAVAVLSILIHHAGVTWLPAGYLGVDVFFVVSGFVITRLLLAEIDAGKFDAAGFWRRRVRRILPAVIVLLVSVLPAAWMLLSPDQFRAFLPVFFGATAMVPNIVLRSQTGYFSPNAETQPLLHLWSLGVEEQFYLFYPLILLVLMQAGVGAGGRRLTLWALGLVSLGLAVVLERSDPISGFYLLLPRGWELLAGCIAALSQWQPGQRMRQILGLIGLGLIFVPMFLLGPRSPGIATLPPVLGAALCLLVARPDTWVGMGLSSSPMVAVGKVSFGAYLWHWPLLAFTRVYLAEDPSLLLKLALMGMALGLGWASWRFVEAPIRRPDRPAFSWFGLFAGFAALGVLAAFGSAAMLADKQGWRNLDWPGYPVAKMDALEAERSFLVRSGTCHLPDYTISSAQFLAQWDCVTRDEAGLKIWPVGVFGDSIAADFAMTLRETGLNPMQMTGADCALAPSQMRPECLEMANLFRASAQEVGLESVILVNYWHSNELTPEVLVELEAWWGEVFRTVAIVGPLPNFGDVDEQWLRWPRERVAAVQPDRSTQLDFLEALAPDTDMRVIDATALFCGARPRCSPLGEGPLILDHLSHLTREGAQLYGRALQDSGVLEELVQ